MHPQSYSRRADSAVLPISAGCGVPRDYDAPLLNLSPRRESDYRYQNNDRYKDCIVDEVEDALLDDEYEDAIQGDERSGYSNHNELDQIDRDSAYSGEDDIPGLNDWNWQVEKVEEIHEKRKKEREDEKWNMEKEEDLQYEVQSEAEESDCEEDAAPNVVASYEEIEVEYLPRILEFTSLPESLSSLIVSYLDQDGSLSQLFEECILLAIRTIESIEFVRTEAKKFNEYLPIPSWHALEEMEESAPPSVKKVLDEICLNDSSSSSSSSKLKYIKFEHVDEDEEQMIDEQSGDEMQRQMVGTYHTYPTRLYLSHRARSGLVDLEKLLGQEIIRTLIQTSLPDSFTHLIVNRMADPNRPELSRARLETIREIFEEEHTAWDHCLNELESRCDAADEEVAFAEQLLYACDYILHSRSGPGASSGIIPVRPFSLNVSDAEQYRGSWGANSRELRDIEPEEVAKAIAMTQDKGHRKNEGKGHKKQDDEDEEMKENEQSSLDSSSAGLSAYVITPINGVVQEPSSHVGSTLEECSTRLYDELVRARGVDAKELDTELAQIPSRAEGMVSVKASSTLTSSSSASSSTAPLPHADRLCLQLHFPRAERLVHENRIYEELMEESVSWQCYQKIIEQADGALNPMKGRCGDQTSVANTKAESAVIELSPLAVLNRRALVGYGEHIEFFEPLLQVDWISVMRAYTFLRYGWKWIAVHFATSESEQKALQGEWLHGHLFELRQDVRSLPLIGRLMIELQNALKSPIYAYDKIPLALQGPSTAAVLPVVLSSPKASCASASATMAEVVDASSCRQPRKKQKSNDGLAVDATHSEEEDAANQLKEGVLGEDDPSLIYTGELAILRRVMTREKHAAAVVLVGYLDQLRSFLRTDDDTREQADSNTITYIHTDELTHLIESTRIAFSHYYLLHMSRSSSLDAELLGLNEYISTKIEMRTTDLTFDRHAFHSLVTEIGQDRPTEVRFTNAAVAAIQEAAEAHMVRYYSLVATNRHATTQFAGNRLDEESVQSRDLLLAHRFFKENHLPRDQF